MGNRVRAFAVCAGAVLALHAPAGAARAQGAPPPASEGVTSYDAGVFASSRPESAYDMVLLVPGFTFDAGQGVRGFASAAGNVLIDGHRPSTKTDALTDILKRIPASSVARIEVIRGGAPGIDMQGRTVLANVVRKASRQLVDTTDALLTPDGAVGVSTRLDFLRRSGVAGLSGSLYLFDHQGEPAGNGSKDRLDPSGAALSLGRVHVANPNSGVQLNGEWDAQRFQGLLRLKGSFLYGTNLSVERDDITGLGGPRRDDFRSQFRTRQLELSADFSRDLTRRTKLSLIAIQNLERADSGGNAVQAGSVIRDGDTGPTGESIVRATLTYTGGPSWSLEGGGEAVYNFFDAKSHLSIDGVPISLPSANVQVAEGRAEAFATLSWRPTPKLAIEAGARYEVSRLTVAGDAHNLARFNFLKPRLTLAWTPGPSDQLRARIERVVGQLDFQDFVTSTSAEQGVTTGGNPELEPGRDWIFEGAWDHRFGNTADVVLTFSRGVLDKVIDQAPVAGLSAPANIGDGVRDRADFDVTLPLGAIGLKGGLLKTQGTWMRSRVVDPTTGASRMITNDQPFTATGSITNDVPRFKSSWRIDLSSPFEWTVFRIDEIDKYRSRGWASALWEWKPRSDLAFQIQAQKFAGGWEERRRLIYGGLRSAGPVTGQELREVRVGPRLYLRVRETL